MKRLVNIAFICMIALLSPCNVVVAQNIQQLFEQVNPSTVVIKTLRVQSVAVSMKKDDFVTDKGLGSGILISDDGKILTAAHVVQAADKVEVEFLDGQRINAKVKTSASWADIAVLQLDKKPRNVKPVTLADSDTVKIGEQVFVIGAPYGHGHTLTVGYISNKQQGDIFANNLAPVELFQTDAAINSGNSGGPLFNMSGEVIGIVSHIESRSGGSEGLGFAVTSNVAKEIMQDSFWSGVEGFLLTGRLAKAFNLPQDSGLLIQHVAEGSMGSRLGLKPSTLPTRIGNEKFLSGGDIILTFGGIRLKNNKESFNQIRSIIKALKLRDTVEVEVYRDGKVMWLEGVIQ